MTIKPPTVRDEVLEANVSTLLETGGEAPRLPEAARSRIRAELIARHGRVPVRSARRPLIAIGLGLAATAAAALIVTRAIGDEPTPGTAGVQTLADGSSWILGPGGKVTELGSRRVRVEGAALLDVAPGKGTFVVETARGTIEVLGTRFLVDASAQRTTAAVVRGEVKLATAEGAVVLHAGEQAVAEAGRPPVRGPAPRLSHLVSWAAEARRRDEHDRAPVRNGTLFARDPGVRNGQFGAEQPLPIKKLGIDVVVENQVARVAIDQTFHNPHGQVLEGVYRFAIPPDAALQRLAMYVDGTLTESAVVERMRARRIYEELVYRRVDPALLEWAGTGRLSLRVYPLPAHQDKRLMLAYTQSLAKLYDDWTLRVPLPEIDQPVGEVALDVTVRDCANCELTSTSHAIEVTRKGRDAVVSYRNTSEQIGDSLVLHVRDPQADTHVTRHVDGDASYLMVRANADLPRAPREYRPRTWVILDDVSASRGAPERQAQADLIDAFVRELDEKDRLAVIAFDVRARTKLAPTRVLDIDRTKLRAALKHEGDVGATDVSVALDAALTVLAGVRPDDAMIVYLGDGVVTTGSRKLDALRAKIAGKARFIGVGVGDGPDTQTLEALAAATGGYTTTIDLADDVRWRAFDLVAALHTARVTGLDARLVDATGALVPSTLYVRAGQLADGEQLEVVAKLAGSGSPATLELTGTLDGAPWRRSIELTAADATADAAYLPRLWAQRHVDARLLAKHEPVSLPPCGSDEPAEATAVVTRGPRAKPAPCPTEAEARSARDEAIRKEVVELGKRYFLLSRHTSLIVLENDAMYAAYGVRKGAGDTWAPYALPAKIPVVTTASPVKPVDVADDAELVRTPTPVFYGAVDNFRSLDGWGDLGGEAWSSDELQQGFGTIGRGSGGAGSGFGRGGGRSRGQLDLVTTRLSRETVTTTSVVGQPQPDTEAEAKEDSRGAFDADDAKNIESADKSVAAGPRARNRRASVTTGELLGASLGNDGLFDGRRGGRGRWGGGGAGLYAQQLHHPSHVSFDDLTAFVPALFPDAADGWRARLTASRGTAPHKIADAARDRLAAARRALPTGVYRWADREIAIDGARRMGWRRTTDADLVETASFDGTSLTRRYAELGLDVTRAIGDDDVALSLAYLPLWIAEPAHYARYFEVGVRGNHEVTLSVPAPGGAKLAFVLELDGRHRLTRIRDGEGTEVLRVTWTDAGPSGAHLLGEEVALGFTPQAIGDAAAWAHGPQVAAPVVVELPMRMATYWGDQLRTLPEGAPTWRHAQRQRMASLAAVGDRGNLMTTYEALRTHGGVELGDLVLASGGVATGGTDAQFAAAVAPFASTVAVARYLIAGRAYGKSPRPERMKPEHTAGLVGALWQLREYTALIAAARYPAAVDRLVAMGSRAFDLRLVAASLINRGYNLKPHDIARAWDSVAIGAYRNIARAHAAQAMMNRGAYDAGADRIAALVADLDLTALPPDLGQLVYQVQNSRRGTAGWQMIWAQWRDKAMTGSSFEHVMALLAGSQYNRIDLVPVLSRAAELAGADVDRRRTVAEAAMQHRLLPLAESIITPLLKATPTRELHLLAAQLAQTQGLPVTVLAHLEAAQDAGADEPVEISTVRGELARIIQASQEVAMASSGAARKAAVARALSWGMKWRAIDPANPDIDRRLGELLLAVGDREEAWRQLSSVIERDPMSGAGYQTVAEAFERQGRVEEAVAYWQQAIVIDQTNPTPRLRKAQALIALGRTAEGDQLLGEVARGRWHDMWGNVKYQAQYLLERAKRGE